MSRYNNITANHHAHSIEGSVDGSNRQQTRIIDETATCDGFSLKRRHSRGERLLARADAGMSGQKDASAYHI